jgi:hypothetical protein
MAVNPRSRTCPTSWRIAFARGLSETVALQGELLMILEEAVPARLSVRQAMERVRLLGIKTPSEATGMIRRMRDGR